MAKNQAKHEGLASEIASLAVFALAVFSVCALITYSPSDPSWLSNARGVATNACGRVGAYFASLFLELFGMGAFLVPWAFFFVSSSVHRREGRLRVATTLTGMSVAVLAATVFLSLQWKFWPFAGTMLLTGGALGTWLAGQMVQQFNPVGSSIVSITVFGLALAVSTPLSVAQGGAAFLAATAYLVKSALVVLAKWLLIGFRALAIFLGKLIARGAVSLAGDFAAITQESAKRVSEALKAWKARRQLALAQADSQAALALSISQPEIADASNDSAPLREEMSELTDITEIAEAARDAVPPELESLSQDLVDAAPSESLAPVTPVAPTSGRVPEILPREIENHAAVAATAPKPVRTISTRARGTWKLPTVEFLKKPPKIESAVNRDRLIQNSEILRQKFLDFGIEGEVTAVRPGPVITLYEFKPGPGVKVSRIAALSDDLSMALSAQSVRILAPLPGKAVVGIEIPSDQRETVYMREFLQHPDFFGSKHSIPVAMGKDIAGQTFLSDLARMPHLLCAGQTGSGKSVFMNGLICSLFYRFTPDDLRMILVDPKFIEFRAYQDMPHLLLPVVDDPQHASTALRWAVREMERRYRILATLNCRNLAAFNQKVEEMGADVVKDLLFSEDNQPDSHVQAKVSGSDWIEAFEPDDSGAPQVGKLPYIVIIIDELADLMMVARKEVEISIARIAQKARAAGIHLIIATQRPSTDVVTGLIKANLPSRVSFQLASHIDSKTILDRGGAEKLLGQGDMLFIPPGVSQLVRLHGAYLEDDEIHKITSFLKAQGKPIYRDEILVSDEDEESDEEGAASEDDELFREAIELVKRSGHASTSFLQRHLKIGYNRAARMIDTMESVVWWALQMARGPVKSF